MTVKTARIEDVIGVRKWDKGQHGPMWYYDLLLDNEERGEIGAKSDDAYHVGQTLTYTSEQTERGFKFKKFWDPNGKTKGNGNGFDKSDMPSGGSSVSSFVRNDSDRNKAFALSYAKDLAVALVAGKDVKSDDAARRCIQIAEEFAKWLNQK